MRHALKRRMLLVIGIFLLSSVSVPKAMATRMVTYSGDGYFLVEGQKIGLEELVFLLAAERIVDVESDLSNAFYERRAQCEETGQCLDEDLMNRFGNRQDLAIQISAALMERYNASRSAAISNLAVGSAVASSWDQLLAEVGDIAMPLWGAEIPPLWGGKDLPPIIFPDNEINPKVAPVPEPGTIFLLGAGLLGIASLHRKTSRKTE